MPKFSSGRQLHFSSSNYLWIFGRRPSGKSRIIHLAQDVLLENEP